MLLSAYDAKGSGMISAGGVRLSMRVTYNTVEVVINCCSSQFVAHVALATDSFLEYIYN